MNVRKDTARTIVVGPILDSAGAAKTDEVVASILASKNGGAAGALNASATLTHANTGYYRLALTVSDIDTLGCLELVLNSTTNSMPIRALNVMTATAWDALHAASGGELPADAIKISGSATAADNLETAALAYSATRGLSGTALPNAAPNADNGVITHDRLLAFLQLLIRKDLAISLDRAAELAILNTDEGSGGGIYDPQNESLEASFVYLAPIYGYTGTTIPNHLTDIKGTGFVKDTHSLPQCLTATGFMPSTEDGSSFTAIPDMATATNLATVAGYLDTEIAAILEDTGTTIPALIAALPTAAENADAVWDEAYAGHVSVGTFGILIGAAFEEV